MTSRDELIEKIMDELHPHGLWNIHQEEHHGYTREKAERILAVFEKAHTPKVIERHDFVMPDAEAPTDDERDALRIAELDARQAAIRKDREDWYVDHEHEPEITGNAFARGWDAAVASSFRHSEVPELSAECPQCHRSDGQHKLGCGERFGSEPQGEPSCCDAPGGPERCGDCHLDREPQSEPTDAQVLAALNTKGVGR